MTDACCVCAVNTHELALVIPSLLHDKANIGSSFNNFTGFLPGYIWQGVPQKTLVVQADIGYDCHKSVVVEIGTIEAPPYACLQNDIIHPIFAKVPGHKSINSKE